MCRRKPLVNNFLTTCSLSHPRAAMLPLAVYPPRRTRGIGGRFGTGSRVRTVSVSGKGRWLPHSPTFFSASGR